MNTATETDVVDADSGHTNSGVQQFVTFLVGDEHFAFPMQDVLEIIRLPATVEVPMTSPSLLGLANLRGGVLPVIDLRTLLGISSIEHTESTRVVVVNAGQGHSVGLIVDRVYQVKNISTQLIDTDSRSTDLVDGEVLQGVIRSDAGEPVTQLLNVTRLIESEFSSVVSGLRNHAATNEPDVVVSSNTETDAESIQLVSFNCDHQEFAFNLLDVEEIVRVPNHIIKVPNAGAHIVGLIELRNRPLPIIDLRYMLGLNQSEVTEDHRIVVASIDRGQGIRDYAGFIVDQVREVLRISDNDRQAVPALLTQGDKGDIDSIVKLDNGKRLVTILSIQAAFGHPAIASAIEQANIETDENMTDGDNTEVDGDDSIVQLVVFKLNQQEYGINIEYVREITRLPEKLDKVPKTPDFIEGVINLRGMVLPVLDMRSRFGIQRIDNNDRQRILVLSDNSANTGFIVDSVIEVLRIERSLIEDSPNLSDEQSKIMGKVVNLAKQKRIIQILAVNELLSKKEKEAITNEVN